MVKFYLLLKNAAELTAATFTICRVEEAVETQAAVCAREVLTMAVRTDSQVLTLVNVW